ncbi:hypothetical protein LTR94_036266, partial [Friedmanniomyces endolithicus]
DAAVAALTDSKHKFDEQREQVTRLAAERDEAQAKLEAAKRQWSLASGGAAVPTSGDRWETGSPGAPAPPPEPAPAPEPEVVPAAYPPGVNPPIPQR